MFKILFFELKKAHFVWVYGLFLILTGFYIGAIIGVANISTYYTIGIPPLSLVLSVNIFTIIWTLMLCTYLGIELFHNEYDQNAVQAVYATGFGRTKLLMVKAAILMASSLVMGVTVVLAAFFAGRPLIEPDLFSSYLASSAGLAFISSNYVFIPLALGMLFKKKVVTILGVVALLVLIGGSMGVNSLTNRPTQLLFIALMAASFASMYVLIYHLSYEDI